MRILLIRHSQTEQSVTRLIEHDNVDVSLSNYGIKESKLLAKRLKKELSQIDTIYSSPAKRAIETAQILSKRKSLNILPELREIDKGFEKVLNQTSPITVDEWEIKFHSGAPAERIALPYPSGETVQSYTKKIYSFFFNLVNEHTSDFAIVAHNGTLKAILSSAINQSDLYYRISIEHGTYTELVYTKEKQFILQKLNA